MPLPLLRPSMAGQQIGSNQENQIRSKLHRPRTNRHAGLTCSGATIARTVSIVLTYPLACPPRACASDPCCPSATPRSPPSATLRLSPPPHHRRRPRSHPWRNRLVVMAAAVAVAVVETPLYHYMLPGAVAAVAARPNFCCASQSGTTASVAAAVPVRRQQTSSSTKSLGESAFGCSPITQTSASTIREGKGEERGGEG